MSSDNVNPDEIKQFNAIGKNWWDPEGPMRMLHRMNPTRLEFINQHSSLKQKKILDVGCGAGLLSEAMAKQGATVDAIDMADEVIDAAKQHANDHSIPIDYQVANINDWAKTHQTHYDIITCLECLEHVPEPNVMIKQCAACLKPGGKLFLSTINRHALAFLGAIVAAEYILRWLPVGTHQYKKFIKPSELSSWCRDAKLDVTDISGFSYHFLSRRFTLSGQTQMNYILCAEKPQ